MEIQLPSQPLHIAVAQTTPKRGDIEANLQSVADFVTRAAGQGARLVLFPEKFLTGYEPDLVEEAPEKYCITLKDHWLDATSRLCADREITAVVGAPTRENEARYISSIIFHSDGRRESYHKQYLFGPETLIYSSGQQDKILDIEGWKIGLAICYDSGFPEHARRLALAGCHVYALSALFSKRTGRQELQIWAPARALDNTMYVALANHCGITGVWDTCGLSGIWSPLGEPVCRAGEQEPALLVTELKPAILQAARAQETMLRDLQHRL